ncbi:hypothetical protein RF11_09800 [Thelohanellus kitauei]|uniref:Uncharacterized protein n=1 Tax=Thelohanellus kitauei TaxID=669202 RepID=A0A0C2NGU7_THEKT|nr:hypothetical protein RF11_09800 [Thelohanellus kitauei]
MDEADLFNVLNYLLSQKIYLNEKSKDQSDSNPPLLSNPKWAHIVSKFNDIRIVDLCLNARIRYKEITNTVVNEYRNRLHHKAIKKIEERVSQAIIRVIKLKFGLTSDEIQKLLTKFKEGHYKTLYWGDEELFVEIDKINWKTTMDKFLVDRENFLRLFDGVFFFGGKHKCFPSLCYHLLSRSDKNRGMVDFAQFISLYKIIKTSNFETKLCILYQMSFYHISGIGEQKSEETTQQSLNLKDPPKYNLITNRREHILCPYVPEIYDDCHAALMKQKVLTNIVEIPYLEPMTRNEFIRFWDLLQILVSEYTLNENLTVSLTIFSQSIIHQYRSILDGDEWVITFSLIQNEISKFPDLVNLINNQIYVKSM